MKVLISGEMNASNAITVTSERVDEEVGAFFNAVHAGIAIQPPNDENSKMEKALKLNSRFKQARVFAQVSKPYRESELQSMQVTLSVGPVNARFSKNWLSCRSGVGAWYSHSMLFLAIRMKLQESCKT